MSGAVDQFPSTDPNLDGIEWLKARYEQFLEHDQWDVACTQYAQGILRGFDANPYLAKIISTEARYLACNSIIAHYFAKQFVGEEGLTLSEVQDAALGGSQLGSRNRVTGLIDTMVFAGLATVEQSEIDRRQRIFKLTDKGKMIIRVYRLSLIQQVDMLQGTNWADRIDEDFLLASKAYKSAVSTFNESGRMSRIFEPFAPIFQRTLGDELLHIIWTEITKSGEVSTMRIVLPYRRLAEQRGVSRAHMRRLIEDCAALGLLQITKSGGKELQVSQAFLDLYRKFTAVRFALTITGVERAAGKQSNSVEK